MPASLEVNLSGAQQNKALWLVKVCFNLNEELAVVEAVDKREESLQVPREHEFVTSTLGLSLAVFSQSEKDGISLEGMVVHRAECQPVLSDNYTKYMKLKKVQVEEVNRPRRVTKQLDRPLATAYRPVVNNSFKVVHQKKKKKKIEERNVRVDRQSVVDMLFFAFEKQQYYSIKELVVWTKQPLVYLKEILRQICVYNHRGPHKHTWELKPEYQIYKPVEKKGGEGTT